MGRTIPRKWEYISTYRDIEVHFMINKQHFLLSAKARILPGRQVFELTEQQAFETFKEVR